MKKLISLLKKYREIVTYLIAGFATTIVSWVTYYLAVLLLPMSGGSFKVLVSNIISWVIAVLFAYVINKIWVFQSLSWEKSYVAAEFIKFVSSRLFTGIIEIVMVPALVTLGLDQKIFGVEGMLSKVIVSILIAILNYVLSKLLIFKEK